MKKKTCSKRQENQVGVQQGVQGERMGRRKNERNGEKAGEEVEGDVEGAMEEARFTGSGSSLQAHMNTSSQHSLSFSKCCLCTLRLHVQVRSWVRSVYWQRVREVWNWVKVSMELSLGGARWGGANHVRLADH